MRMSRRRNKRLLRLLTRELLRSTPERPLRLPRLSKQLSRPKTRAKRRRPLLSRRREMPSAKLSRSTLTRSLPDEYKKRKQKS